MPQLSEAWATAYIQILTMLCIFALGIPALMFQLVVQEDIRHVFQRHMRVTGWVTSVVIILLTFTMFVWFLHPPFRRLRDKEAKKAFAPTGVVDAKTSPTPTLTALPGPIKGRKPVGSQAAQKKEGDRAQVVAAASMASPGPGASISPNPIIVQSNSGSPTQNASTSDDASRTDNEDFYMRAIFASLAMTLIPVVMIALGFMQVSYLKRPHLIKYLEEELIHDFPQDHAGKPRVRDRLFALRHGFFRKYHSKKKILNKKGTPAARDSYQQISRALDEETLYDLLYLGQHGKSGKEKELALGALARIAAIVQSSEDYQGDELEDLIRGLKDVVLNDERSGDDDNFKQVIEIIKHIRSRFSSNESRSRYIDAGLAVTVLEELGVEAVKTKSAQTAERFMEEAAFSSSIVFNMGLTALSNKQFHIASFALNKLESLAEDKHLAACPETFDLLGLIAHFVNSGVAARRRADSFLTENARFFKPSINECLGAAYEHHYFGSNFGTADAIFELEQDVMTRRWSESLSSAI